MIEKNEFDVADLRREYTRGGLRRHDLTANPLELFERWLKQACDARPADPTAMCVATVDEHGQPYQRIVLLKHFDEQGLVFYTNLGSRKAQQLAHNPHISLLFPAHARSPVIFLGGGASVDPRRAEVFQQSPERQPDRRTGVAAIVAHFARGVLESKFLELKQKFQQGEVPLPSFWGGFRVKFDSVEFWQGGAHRLHDRFLYQRDGNDWKIDRLAP